MINLVVIVHLLSIHSGLVRLAHIYELEYLIIGGRDGVGVDGVVDVGYVLLLRRVWVLLLLKLALV